MGWQDAPVVEEKPKAAWEAAPEVDAAAAKDKSKYLPEGMKHGPERLSESMGGALFHALGTAIVPHNSEDTASEMQKVENAGKSFGLSFDEMIQAARQYLPGMDHEAATREAANIASRKDLLPHLDRAAGAITAMLLPYGAAGKVATMGNAAMKAQVVKQLLGVAVVTMATTPTESMKNFGEEKAKQGAVAGGSAAALAVAGFALGTVVKPVSKFVREVIGSKNEIIAARGTAQEIAKGEIKGQILKEEAAAKARRVDAEMLEKARVTTLEKVKARSEQKPGPDGKPVTLQSIGEDMHETVNGVFDAAKAARKAQADPAFANVLKTAQAKEAAGGRVSTEEVERTLSKAMAKVQGTELEGQYQQMLNSVKDIAGIELKGHGLDITMGKSVEQLEQLRRHFNDIGFSTNYSSGGTTYGDAVKHTARQAAKEIDTAITKFVPEFGAYKSEYARLSKPLEALGTRLGKMITKTEGGLQGDAFAATPKQKLPQSFLSTRDGQEKLQHILQGGDEASPIAKDQAEKVVSKWAEQWVLEDTRQMGGAEALKKVDNPAMRSALSERTLKSVVPKVTNRVNLEKAAVELQGHVDTARKAADEAAKHMDKLANVINNAQQLESGGMMQKKQALDAYMTAINDLHNAKLPDGTRLVPEGKWRAAHAAVNKAETMGEKTEKARKLAMGLAAIAGTSGTLIWGSKHIMNSR